MAADGEILSQYVMTRSEAAFELLVGRHGSAVYGTCLRMLGDAAEAEDAAQATFMVLAAKAASVDGHALAGWLHVTAALVARNALRERRRRRRREEEASRMAARRPPQRSAAAWSDISGRLDEAVAALPADQRNAVVLAYFQNLNRDEVARETGCSRGTVDSRLARAIEKLRRVLGGSGPALPAAALVGLISGNAVGPLPAGLAAKLTAAGGASAAAAAPAASALAKGAVQAMFWTKVKLTAAVVAAVAALGGGGLVAAGLTAGEPSRGAPAGAITVLNLDTLLRSHLVFSTPVMVGKDGQLKPVPNNKPKATGPLAEFRSPLPPADWIKPDFDDSSWERDRAPIEAGPEDETWNRYAGPSNSLICARARFSVGDPGKVQDLKLSLEYVGGVVVYVNGREVARGHLPSGELKPDTLAEKYPDDLYCEPEGRFLTDTRKNPAGFGRRFRKLADVEVPARVLRKGANVLAVEVHRAAINEAAVGASRAGRSGAGPGIWAYAGLKDLALTAGAGSALSPNVGRPAGIQVWNCLPHETVTAFDYGDGGAFRPVTISSPRNGVFSGRLAVSSDQAIKDLRVTVSDLDGPGGGRLTAASVRVRVAEAGTEAGRSQSCPRYNGLLDAIPAEIPVIKATASTDSYPKNYLRIKYQHGPQFPVSRKGLSAGAVAPIWLTVRVPRDAAPGSYEGTVTVSAAGLPATAVPLKVVVLAWTMPDPRDFRIVNFGQHSPDSLALYYNVPLWSDRHFELMGRSLALMAEVNSRQAIVDLTANFYSEGRPGGNSESMVRWVKQADPSAGSGQAAYEYDFTVFDKYLNMVARSMGKPALLRINFWNDSALADGKLVPGLNGKVREKNFNVTVIDPATGKLDTMEVPTPGTEESFVFWKPVLDEVRRKVEARGWWDVTAVGWNSYNRHPRPETVSVCRRIWPDGVWSFTSHAGTLGGRFAATEKGVSMPVRHADCVWTRGQPKPRGYRALLEPRPNFWCYTFRTEFKGSSDLAILRDIPEEEIMSGHDGVSDFGVDFFAFKAPSGKLTHVACGGGTGGPSCSTWALLAPGPDGPTGSEHHEMLREGVEIGEAILFLEKALQEKKIKGDLAARVNRHLDERGEVFIRRWPSGRFERDVALLELAGEAAKAIGAEGK